MDIQEFEESVRRGERVEVRWRDRGRTFCEEGVVLFVSKKSFSIALVEGNDLYKKGRRVMVPRYGVKNWSEDNRVSAKKKRLF